jgi:hypothetical protein
VALSYWRFAKQHYRKYHRPTSVLEGVKQALRPLRRLYGSARANDFGPLALKAVGQQMIDGGMLSRDTINTWIGAIKRVFKWAVSEELVPASVTTPGRRLRGSRRVAAKPGKPTGYRPRPSRWSRPRCRTIPRHRDEATRHSAGRPPGGRA